MDNLEVYAMPVAAVGGVRVIIERESAAERATIRTREELDSVISTLTEIRDELKP